MYRWDGELFHLLAEHNAPPVFAEVRRRSAFRPSIGRRTVELHSREGSGEHRLVDVNALVEESLNLGSDRRTSLRRRTSATA
jgi:hypothetical protein